jgi:hypothetical protein
MKKLYVLIILLLQIETFHAQQYYQDARLWTNVYFEKSFGKSFNIHINQKDRFNHNMQKFELGYADVGVTYKLTKNVKFLLDYVYALKHRNDDSWSSRRTAYVAVVLRKDLGRFRVLYRNLAQVSYKNLNTSKTGYIPYYYDRNKVTLKYEATKRFEFYVAEEITIPLFIPQGFMISRSRAFAGMFVNVTKHQVLEFYFALQQQFVPNDFYKQKNSYPNTPQKRDYIYGVGYSFLF